MLSVRMVSTSTHQYAGHRLAVGEEFDCEVQHVDLFEKHGWAKRKEESQAYQTRHMEAVTPRRARRRRK